MLVIAKMLLGKFKMSSWEYIFWPNIKDLKIFNFDEFDRTFSRNFKVT